MKVAIVHDWLTSSGGAEKVLAHFIEIWPEADLYCVVDFMPEADREFLKGRRPKTTFIQTLPFAKKQYRQYLPLMPIAIEQFDLSGYDLIISSSYAVAKGIVTGPDTTHVCYCHSPVRYGWDLQHQYLRESGMESGFKSMAARALLHYLRMWDVRTAFGVDLFIANSQFTARRIKKAYGRNAIVIYPPVQAKNMDMSLQRDDFYLSVSRLVPYKRMDLMARTFSEQLPEKKLVLIGEGPEYDKIKALSGPNVTLMGKQPWSEVKSHLSRAKAFVFAAEEDFGIAPVEAQASGAPIIGFKRGGLLETTVGVPSPYPTAVFFQEQTPSALAQAVREFEALPEGTFSAKDIRAHALQFDERVFTHRIKKAVDAALSKRSERKPMYLQERRRSALPEINDRWDVDIESEEHSQ